MIWIAIVMLSALPLYLSSWMVFGWLIGANTLVQTYVVRDLHVGGQIHRTPYLAGIFSGTAALVALRWIFTILPCTSPDLDRLLIVAPSQHILFSTLSLD